MDKNTMGPFILAVAGLTCSGKSLFASSAEENGFCIVRTASFVADGEFQIKKFIDNVSKKILKSSLSFFAIDSIRDRSQFLSISKVFPKISLITIHCDHRERRIRYESRRSRRPSIETFDERDEREICYGMGDLYCISHRVIDNTGLNHAEFRSLSQKIILNFKIECQSSKPIGTRWEKEERNICFPKYIKTDGIL